MEVNIFEGARRVAKLAVLVAVLAYIGSIAYEFAYAPKIDWREIGSNAGFPLGWLAFLLALTWAVGWIVRGFLGIPHGQDRRPSASKE